MADKDDKKEGSSSKPEHSQQCEDIRNCAQTGGAIAAILVAVANLTSN